MQKKCVLPLTVLAAFLFLVVSQSALAEGKFSGKIIDGTLVPATQFPATTLVLLPDSLCTGTLIAEKYVLTAAHCFFNDQNNLITNLSGVSAVVNNVGYAAKKVTIHPTYESSDNACIPGQTDAAVLELTSAVNGVAPIPLYRSAPAIGDSVQLVGFGTQGKGATGQDDTLPPDGFVNFAFTNIETIDNNEYVSWVSRVGFGNTASGDSGGPAFIVIAGLKYLHSITCGGTGNAEYGSDSTNTRVDTMAAWIDSVAGTSPPNTPPSFFGLNPITTVTNQSFSYSIQVSGAAPISITSSELPPGLTLSGTTISGVPTTPGTYTVTLEATNNIGATSGTLSFIIGAFDPNSLLTVSSAKIDFRDNDANTFEAKGTLTLPDNFSPKGAVVIVSVAGISQNFKLNKNGLGERRRRFDFVRFTGKTSKGKYTNPTVRFSIGLVDSEVLYDTLFEQFPEDISGLAPDFNVSVPLQITVGGSTTEQVLQFKVKGRLRWTKQ